MHWVGNTPKPHPGIKYKAVHLSQNTIWFDYCQFLQFYSLHRLNSKSPLSVTWPVKQSLNLVCYFACVGEWAGVGMLNVPIHKPHRQKNYRSSTGKSTGGETLQLDVLRAVQTQYSDSYKHKNQAGKVVDSVFWQIKWKWMDWVGHRLEN